MSIVASTLHGQVGVAEKEFRTFQPFFIVHDPPPVLTEGDRISLPVILRNYLGKPERVVAELQPQDWFAILSAPRQSKTIAANSDANTSFSFRAIASTKKGLQRVSARNAKTGDAVERQVVVHPDGEEISQTVAKVVRSGDDSLDFDVPATALRGSAEAELRIYPNLIAHMIDALSGLDRRPAGCNEQITSIGLSNLLLLQALKKTGQHTTDPASQQSSFAARARQHLQDAYILLTQTQRSDGSFGYWRGTKSDVALTAYVLRFLKGASEFISVDEHAIAQARDYLLHQQSKSGAWQAYDWRDHASKDNPNLSAYVARALAVTRANTQDQQSAGLEGSLTLAMNYLEGQIDSWNDAYLVGNYAMVAAADGQTQRISKAQAALASLAHREGPATYWNLEANTSPFYGWGSASRLETTALAVEALAMIGDRDGNKNLQEIDRGLQFLLSHKDRYAMWYSTQATQNTFEAILAAIPLSQEPDHRADATVRLNGTVVSTIHLPTSQTIAGPIVLDLSNLVIGRNHLEIARPNSASPINVALMGNYYVPPDDSKPKVEENLTRGDTRALRLKVHFDRTEMKLASAVSCKVEAERIGFAGYGMMIAEIGLPPGADVDRASLETAKGEGAIDAYEVQPDKVVFYLWPTAGGSKFEFHFHSRLLMEAMSGPSLLYDYYNPEAAVTVSAVRFIVH
jgi:hypothetical protein